MPPTRLSRAAAAYIDRYAPNTQKLRQFLERRIWKAEPDERPALRAEAEAFVTRVVEAGLINDAVWAEDKARRLTRRGVAPGVARQRLRAAGADPGPAFETVEAEVGDPAVAAARAFARRRRLGPFRREGRAEARKDDLAKMGRAGFGWSVAVSIIDAPDDGEG